MHENPALVALEDNPEDVLGKAMAGLGLNAAAVAQRCGLSEEEVREALAGRRTQMEIIAEAVGLPREKVRQLCEGTHLPAPPPSLEGWKQFTTDFDGMLVHSYLLWDAATGEALAFDTGADATEMLDFLQTKGLRLRNLFLTHTHGDHIFDLDRLVEKTGATAWGPQGEPLPGVRPLSLDASLSCGPLRGRILSTKGHSADGLTYFWEGLECPVAIVGDALFAGSMGGPKISYADALQGVKDILALPEETLLCPGHGPCTTVREEKLGNPFFGAKR